MQTEAHDHRCVIHLDFDAYYAQVEAKRLGIGRDVPLAVQQWEGLIAVNYAARARGITRHMRIGDAKKLCPELVLAHVETIGAGGAVHEGGTSGEFKDKRLTQKASLERYRRSTAEVMALLHRLLPAATIEKASIDECYLDVTALVDREMQAQRQQEQEQEGQLSAGQWSGHAELEQEEAEEEGHAEEDWAGGGSQVPRNAAAAALPLQRQAAIPADAAGAPEAVAAPKAAPKAGGAASAFAWGAIVMGDSPLDPGSEWDRRLAAAAGIACRVRGAILNELQYTSSAGIATNKLLAKIGSAMHKPNQMTVIPPRAAVAVMRDLPLGKVRGFGGKLGEELEGLGCTTAGQVQDLPPGVLERHFGVERARHISETVRGMSHDPVVEKEKTKSMLAAKSFNATSDLEALQGWLRILATELAQRMAVDQTENRRRPRNLVLTYRAAGGTADRSKSVPMPRFGPEGPAPEPIAEAALNLLRTRCLPAALPCNRLAIAASDFTDLPATGSNALTRFLVPKQAAGSGGGGGADAGGGDSVSRGTSPAGEARKGAAKAAQQAEHGRGAGMEAEQQQQQQKAQHGPSIDTLFERAQKRQRVSTEGTEQQQAQQPQAPEQEQQQQPRNVSSIDSLIGRGLKRQRESDGTSTQPELLQQQQQQQPGAAPVAADAPNSSGAPDSAGEVLMLGPMDATDEQAPQSHASAAPHAVAAVAVAGAAEPAGEAAGAANAEPDPAAAPAGEQGERAMPASDPLLREVDIAEQRRILKDIEMRQMLERRPQPAATAGGSKGGRGAGRQGGRGKGSGGGGSSKAGQPSIAAFFSKS